MRLSAFVTSFAIFCFILVLVVFAIKVHRNFHDVRKRPSTFCKVQAFCVRLRERLFGFPSGVGMPSCGEFYSCFFTTDRTDVDAKSPLTPTIRTSTLRRWELAWAVSPKVKTLRRLDGIRDPPCPVSGHQCVLNSQVPTSRCWGDIASRPSIHEWT